METAESAAWEASRGLPNPSPRRSRPHRPGASALRPPAGAAAPGGWAAEAEVTPSTVHVEIISNLEKSCQSRCPKCCLCPHPLAVYVHPPVWTPTCVDILSLSGSEPRPCEGLAQTVAFAPPSSSRYFPGTLGTHVRPESRPHGAGSAAGAARSSVFPVRGHGLVSHGTAPSPLAGNGSCHVCLWGR